MFGLNPWEMGLIFLIILVIFGPKSLPKIGQSIGRGIREFKDAAQGLTSDLQDDTDKKPTPAPTAPSPQVSQSARTVEEDLAVDDKVNHSA